MKPTFDGFEAARYYWSLPLKERNYAAVAKKFGLLKEAAAGKTLGREAQRENKQRENQIGVIIRRYEQNGGVQHVVLPAPGNEEHEYLPLVPGLEDVLRQRYHLRDVVVVETDSLKRPDGDPLKNVEEWNFYDDQVHRCLGRWAGRVLASILRPHDVVGTGGGRGPYYTVRACIIPPTGPQRPNKVISLTGEMTTHVWRQRNPAGRLEDRNLPSSLDADNIANILTSQISTQQPQILIRRPITDTRVKNSPAFKTIPSIALIGIGALGGNHRLLRDDLEGTDLQPVKNELARLRELARAEDAKTDGNPPHHWVGDICNHLFVVEDVGPHKLERQKRKELTDVVTRLNAKFINKDTKFLSDVCKKGVAFAVAGGPHKGAAIAHVLRHQKTAPSEPWITHLITDKANAEFLLTLPD